MAETDGRLGKMDGVHGRFERRVGNVDPHSQSVHTFHHLDPKLAKAAVVSLVLPVAYEILAVVGQPSQPYSHGIEHIQMFQLTADRQVL